MLIALHSHGTGSFPAFPKERLIPQFPPNWATAFGEDDQGIFAKLERFDFEFRWIMPQQLEIQGEFPASKFVEGFWLAEKAFPRDNGNWGSESVKNFVENCALANSCPIRIPTHTQLLAAKDTLRLIEAARGIEIADGQVEICLNDTRALGLNSLIIYDILVDTLNLKIVETDKAETANSFLRLAIQPT